MILKSIIIWLFAGIASTALMFLRKDRQKVLPEIKQRLKNQDDISIIISAFIIFIISPLAIPVHIIKIFK